MSNCLKINKQFRKEARWYVLRTRTKSEHIAAAGLERHSDVEIYCPRLRFQRMTARGKVFFIEALFPGYIFARFCADDRLRTVKFGNAIVDILKFGTQYANISNHVIDQIRDEMGRRDIRTIEVLPEPGEEVEICAGPFNGMNGVVTRMRDSAQRLRLLLNFLGRVNEIEVATSNVKVKHSPQVAFGVS